MFAYKIKHKLCHARIASDFASNKIATPFGYSLYNNNTLYIVRLSKKKTKVEKSSDRMFRSTFDRFLLKNSINL